MSFALLPHLSLSAHKLSLRTLAEAHATSGIKQGGKESGSSLLLLRYALPGSGSQGSQPNGFTNNFLQGKNGIFIRALLRDSYKLLLNQINEI
jgi:hypothetical protein